eukprot:gene21522-28509_t
MGCEDIIKKLQEQKQSCEQDDSLGGKVAIEQDLLSATMGGLLEAVRLQKQLDEVQEQNSMKPSVARRLNDRIRELEAETTMLRGSSRVTELEKKVQKLEGELKQSYATKNYTLKSGLLDIEKRYRDYIYASPDVEELWTEVMMLLIEDKEAKADMLKVRSQHIADLGGREPCPSAASVTNPASSIIKEAGNLAPVLPQLPAPPAAKSSCSTPRISQVADARAVEMNANVDGKPDEMGFVRGVRARYSGKGLPALPPTQHPLVHVNIFESNGKVDASGLHQHKKYMATSITELFEMFSHMTAAPHPTAEGSATSNPHHTSTLTLLCRRQGGKVDASGLHQHNEYMATSITELREMFSHLTAAPLPTAEGSARSNSSGGIQVDALDFSMSELLQTYAGHGGITPKAASTPGVGGVAGQQQPHLQLKKADASYFDSQTEGVLASIQQLQALYAQHGGGVTPGGGGAGRGGGEVGTQLSVPDASYFTKQTDTLAASIHNLRLMYDAKGVPLPPPSPAGTPYPSSFSATDALAASIHNLRLMYDAKGVPLLPPAPSGAPHPSSAVPGSHPSLGEAPCGGDPTSEGRMVHLFSSFMAELEGQGICLLRVNKGSEGDVSELSRMFAQFVGSTMDPTWQQASSKAKLAMFQEQYPGGGMTPHSSAPLYDAEGCLIVAGCTAPVYNAQGEVVKSGHVGPIYHADGRQIGAAGCAAPVYNAQGEVVKSDHVGPIYQADSPAVVAASSTPVYNAERQAVAFCCAAPVFDADGKEISASALVYDAEGKSVTVDHGGPVFTAGGEEMASPCLEYDAEGRATTKGHKGPVYDAGGKELAVSTLLYDSAGNVIAAQAPMYNADGTAVTAPPPVYDADNNGMANAYPVYDTAGNLVAVRAPVYDAAGNPVVLPSIATTSYNTSHATVTGTGATSGATAGSPSAGSAGAAAQSPGVASFASQDVDTTYVVSNSAVLTPVKAAHAGVSPGGAVSPAGAPPASSPGVSVSPGQAPRRSTLAQQMQEQIGPKHAPFIAENAEALELWQEVLALAAKHQERELLTLRALPQISLSTQAEGASGRVLQLSPVGQEQSPALETDGMHTPSKSVAGTGQDQEFNNSDPGVVSQHQALMAGLKIDNLRALNAQYAEHLAEQGGVALMLTEQHQLAMERADELEMRLANATSQLLDANTSKAESEAELLELTGLLVGVKMDLAEKDFFGVEMDMAEKRYGGDRGFVLVLGLAEKDI